MSHVTYGIHFCIGCFQRREFVSYGDQRDAALAECFACGHRYGKCRDEHAVDEATGKYTTVERNVLTDDQVIKAQEQRLAEHRRTRLSTGVRREVVMSERGDRRG